MLSSALAQIHMGIVYMPSLPCLSVSLLVALQGLAISCVAFMIAVIFNIPRDCSVWTSCLKDAGSAARVCTRSLTPRSGCAGSCTESRRWLILTRPSLAQCSRQKAFLLASVSCLFNHVAQS